MTFIEGKPEFCKKLTVECANFSLQMTFLLTSCPFFAIGSIFAIFEIGKKANMTEENNVQNEEQENVKDQSPETVEDVSAGTDAKEETQETPQAPTMEDKYNELNNKYLRIHAEFDNYRKRTNKEKVDLISTASAGVLKDLLPVLDDFERAIANNEKAEDIESVKEGFNLIFNKFSSLLQSKGVKEMPATGETFDSELHEAIANIPAPKKKLKGKVVEAVEKGYFLNDKVIRYAKVVVGQ